MTHDGPRETADPALAALGSRLATAGVRWAVLRGGIERPGAGDLDLLVHPADVGAFRAVARSEGFPRLPAWGHGHHRFHLGRGRGGWWRLDLVDTFRFAGGARLDAGVVEAALDRRSAAPVPRLHPDDAAWALTLHLLLDRERRSAADRERLGLAASAEPSGPLAAALGAVLPEGTTPFDVLHALRDDAPSVAGLRRAVHRRLREQVRRSREIDADQILQAAQARLRKPLTALYRSGPSVALMGPDGAGKSALLDGLRDAFPLPVRTAYLGLYQVGGVRRGGPKGLGFARRIAMLWRRHLTGRVQRWRGRLVIFDRHPLDARLEARGRTRPTDRLRRWALGHALPVPELVLVLDAPGVVLHARKAEFPAATLELDRARYRALAGRLTQAQIVDAARPADEVLDDVVDRIWQVWANRLDPPPR